jgi:uncharacterized protein with HEPN domain
MSKPKSTIRGDPFMRRDPKAYLWDAAAGATAIQRFISGRSYDDYLADEMLRSAVERQFEIIGEALSQLTKIEPELAAQIPDLPRIVAFRNILIHGYAVVDNEIVWRAAQENLPELAAILHRLLEAPS